MTRRLPWNRDGPARTPVSKKPSTPASANMVGTPRRANPRAAVTPTPRQQPNKKPTLSNGALGERSPSTSPPPQPIPEICMIEGLENDDKYRMVEDEFFVAAGQFTAHLHAAEYHRLRAQTRTQNAETIRNISRPVVGTLTELARKRQEELLRKKKQREALRRAKLEAVREDEGSGDETGVPWRGTALQGLMDSPRKKEVPLMALARADSGARASSLFGGVVRSRIHRTSNARREEGDEETEDESGDDLGSASRAPLARKIAHDTSVSARPVQAPKSIAKGASRSITHRGATSSSYTQAPVETTAPSSRGSSLATAAVRAVSSTSPASTKTSTRAGNDIDNDDDDEDDIFTRFKIRRPTARQRREPGRKAENPAHEKGRDIIPSFI
ncbi:hypothetical protein CCHL11_07338 [Colletotrichum chlorophyti]|uniref:Uncharacterized protein n=1 Tax=Colletotrichum chlorophyti TaxID=708187 RepID=A0A1Q8RA26_9PEZI|nr:hypothetical protein CCHL11_07338 [Colletotrichum chlorophyti]